MVQEKSTLRVMDSQRIVCKFSKSRDALIAAQEKTYMSLGNPSKRIRHVANEVIM